MIGLYCPDIPPIPGGVSDHTLALARAIAALGGPVAVLAERGDCALFAPIPCRAGLKPGHVAAAAKEMGVTTIVVQYVPFLWARRGVSPAFVRGVHRMRDAGLRLAVVVHEAFVPFTRLPWLVTGIPQRLQYRYLLHRAAYVYAPLPRYAEIARCYAAADTNVTVAPIGATIPVSPLTRDAARTALGLAPDTVAIGVFSPAAAGFSHDWIAAAVRRLASHPRVTWVLFGFGSAKAWPGFPSGDHVIVAGEGTPDRIAATMRAIDIAAAPYVDGLTMRRSGAMLALATGIPTVSSMGHLFDADLTALADCEPDAAAFAEKLARLADDPAARLELAARARNYGRMASMESLAQRMIDDLETAA